LAAAGSGRAVALSMLPWTPKEAKMSVRMSIPMIALGAMLTLGCKDEVSAPAGVPDLPTPPTRGAIAGSAPVYNTAATERGYLDGWFNGETVQLYYTKWFFCAEPPESGAGSNCEIGADAEVAPRPGPIPTIYAIAAVGGIQPDLSTLACPPGSVCLNHPAMIDVSRLRGPGFENAPALPHSHIVSERRAGWFKTVNVRVSNLDVWNQIAAAKSLATVRALQADPAIGGKGLISQDTPTNIYFFIASWR
jgi:hypothetical protein